MPNALVVEDDASDLRQATSLLTGMGFEQVEPAATVSAALRFLDDVADRKRPVPDLILLDLSLGYESGFEVLRRWKSDNRLKAIKIVIWTQMGEREQELCRLFGLQHIVPKWKSLQDLQTATQAAMGKSQERSL
jgi:CheY-like chemotaxis protein